MGERAGPVGSHKMLAWTRQAQMPPGCRFPQPGGRSLTSLLLSLLPPHPWVGRYVKTTANATVDHLSKYLALRIALEEAPGPGPEGPALDDVSEKQYTIYITTTGGAFTVRGAEGWWEGAA